MKNSDNGSKQASVAKNISANAPEQPSEALSRDPSLQNANEMNASSAPADARTDETKQGDEAQNATTAAQDKSALSGPNGDASKGELSVANGDGARDDAKQGASNAEHLPPQSELSSREKRKQNALADITHFDNHSFLALLVRSFLSFMLITVGATLLIVLVANWASNNSRINISVQSIEDYDYELINNPANPSVPLEVILGAGGWLDIVDAESGKVLYSSQPSEERAYTLDELVCIQESGGTEISSVKFDTADGSYNYFISKTYDNGTNTPDEYLLLSAEPELRQLSGNMPEFKNKAQFTQREFELLVYNPNHAGQELKKHAFVSRDGARCYAVYLDVNNDEVTPPWLFIVITIIGIVGLLITALGFYIRYINKHVQRPLNALGNAMADFAKSGYREKLNYIGSKDFEQLVAAFNEMVGLLNASEQQRLALEKDRQRMLAGLSHDLKTPMTVIEGFSKAIRDGVVAEEDKPKYLNLIISKSEYVGELINEFYEYSKLDHPDFVLTTQTLDIVEFVRSFLAEKYDEFDIRGYELQANLSDGRLMVNLDREKFSRVLDNLVGNFFKYTPKGSTLTVEEKEAGEFAEIYVMDNGGGIPDKARADIFAPFVVAEESRSKQGSGLGLAVCKKIVEAHGGEIELLPPNEKYKTIFRVALPLVREQESKK